MTSPKMSPLGWYSLRIYLLTAILFVGLSQVHGVEPTYKDCRPHIDATIRDLASKALNAGEEPSREPSSHAYGGKESQQNDQAAIDDERTAPQPEEISLPDEEPPVTVENPEAEEEPLEAVEEPSDTKQDRSLLSSSAEPEEEIETSDDEVFDDEDSKDDEEASDSNLGIEDQDVKDVLKEIPLPVDETPESSTPAEERTASMSQPQPCIASSPPVTSTPVYTPPVTVESDSIFNKLVYSIFGETNAERDPKYAQPWQTHAEHRKVTPVVEQQKKIDVSSGFIGRFVNTFVETVFGSTTGKRDPKYAQPWQSHPEHSTKTTKKESEATSKVYVYSEGIIHKIIVSIFGEVKGSRDPKYAQPWQSHDDQQRKYVPEAKEKVKVTSTEGGIIDSLVRLIFQVENKARDPKYSKPWQTHDENIKPQAEGTPAEKHIAEAIGGPIDKLFVFLFNVDKNAVRDPKYAKPWQTHDEHAEHMQRSSETKSKKTSEPFFKFEFINSIIYSIFGPAPRVRDEKWSQPWQTHAEHFKPPSAKTQVKEHKADSIVGGFVNSIVQSLFGTGKDQPRDSKWAKPWQSHDESAPIVPTRKSTAGRSQPEQVKVESSLQIEKNSVEKTLNDKEKISNEIPEKKSEDQTFLHAKDSDSSSRLSDDGLINRAIYFLFGKVSLERNPKFSKPWQTHPEFKKLQGLEENKVVDTSSGFVGKSINKLITTIFGEHGKERDSKYAHPWQTHDEHKKTVQEDKPNKVIDTSTGFVGELFNKFVTIIFGRSDSKRDPKYAEPWQSHEDQQRKYAVVTEKNEEKNKIDSTEGGIINSLIRIVFPEKGGSRDPKYSKPWQTHIKNIKPQLDSSPMEVQKVGDLGGPIDKLVVILFNIDTEAVRDPKYSKPWQTHKEHAGKNKIGSGAPNSEKVERLINFEFIDKIMEHIFGKSHVNRNKKWAEPWQSHDEHKNRISSKANEKKQEKTPSRNNRDTMSSYLSKLSEEIQQIFLSILPVKDSAPIVPVSSYRSAPVAEKLDHTDGIVAETSVPPKTTDETGRNLKLKSEAKSPTETLKVVPETEKSKTQSSNKPKYKEKKESTQINFQTKLGKEDSSSQKPEGKADKNIQGSPEAPDAKKSSSNRGEKLVSDGKSPNSHRAEKNTKNKSGNFSKSPPKTGKQKIDRSPTTAKTIESKDKNEKTMEPESDDVDAKVSSPTPSTPPVADSPSPPQQQEEEETTPDAEEEDDENEEQIVMIPGAPRSRDHIEAILGLDAISRDTYKKINPIADSTLKDLKGIYASSVKPLEETFKFQDISNRHMSDAQIFGPPLVLMLGPYSTGKSTFINYLMGVENSRRALRTGANPSHGVFRIIQYGTEDQELDGTALSADWAFRSLQKFGQNFIDQLRGRALNVPLLKKVTFVEAPGILEMRRPGERQYPFNDVLQWFIDRADLVLVMFDYTKLDAGYELEAALDQLKGREGQVRILLNKADQIPPEELIKVQGSLFWNLSPLLGVSVPPTVYAGSFSSRPYRSSSPAKLFQAQEEALLHDIAKAINNRVDNRVAIARRHAVRVRNHAQMVDTYLTTYFNNKGFLTSKHKLAEDIVENPHLYNIYEGMSLITNISRYDLPDPEIYRDFFRVHNLYDFPALKDTCSFLQGCPLDIIDKAISTDLPELLNKYRRQLTSAGVSYPLPDPGDFRTSTSATIPPLQPSKL